MGQRNRNRAGARAHVHNARPFKIRRKRKRLLHQVLRLRPRNQHVAVHLKRQPVKLRLAGDVLHRFARQPPLKQRVVAHGALGGQLRMWVRHKKCAVALNQVQHQHLSVASSALRMRPAAQTRLAVLYPALEESRVTRPGSAAFNCSAW